MRCGFSCLFFLLVFFMGARKFRGRNIAAKVVDQSQVAVDGSCQQLFLPIQVGNPAGGRVARWRRMNLGNLQQGAGDLKRLILMDSHDIPG